MDSLGGTGKAGMNHFDREAPGNTREAPGRHKGGTREAPGRHQGGRKVPFGQPGRHQGGRTGLFGQPARHQGGRKVSFGQVQALVAELPLLLAFLAQEPLLKALALGPLRFGPRIPGSSTAAFRREVPGRHQGGRKGPFRQPGRHQGGRKGLIGQPARQIPLLPAFAQEPPLKALVAQNPPLKGTVAQDWLLQASRSTTLPLSGPCGTDFLFFRAS